MKKMSIKKDDLVVVLSGKDKGKQGKVLEVQPKSGKVVVENINVVSRHTKPRKQGDQGGILKKEAPLYACKVQKVCPKCNKPTRIGHKVEGLRLQGAEGLPQVQQAHPHRPQGRGRQEGPHLQEVRRRDLREEE